MTSRCDAPVPRPSYWIHRTSRASASKAWRRAGIRHSPSMLENGTPGRWMSAGPSPTDLHAMLTPSAEMAVPVSGMVLRVAPAGSG